ncbi:hypothetical protein F6S41_20950 [Pseudomonas aeruginosa]|nr:hypothetical protein [Pseudomonas aeruginosa]HBN8375777.1 hypothetical protein [Pseudomonas aeruginosa]
MNKEWISVSQKDINKPSKPQIYNGARTQFMMSPSDIPSAFRYSIDEDAHSDKIHGTIEFKYLSESETLRKLSTDSNMEIEVGTQSGRVYKISFTITRAEFNRIQNAHPHDDAKYYLSGLDHINSKKIRNKSAIQRVVLNG